jgi:hypothetical protein
VLYHGGHGRDAEAARRGVCGRAVRACEERLERGELGLCGSPDSFVPIHHGPCPHAPPDPSGRSLAAPSRNGQATGCRHLDELGPLDAPALEFISHCSAPLRSWRTAS